MISNFETVYLRAGNQVRVTAQHLPDKLADLTVVSIRDRTERGEAIFARSKPLFTLLLSARFEDTSGSAEDPSDINRNWQIRAGHLYTLKNSDGDTFEYDTGVEALVPKSESWKLEKYLTASGGYSIPLAGHSIVVL